jgi:hypothetical protein
LLGKVGVVDYLCRISSNSNRQEQSWN